MFACLHNDQYTVANIQNLHVLTYHQQTRRLPFAKLVRQDVGLFSEEAGEVAFSLLSRSTLGDSVEDKHRRLTDCFQSIGAMREIKLDHFIDDEPANPKASRTTVAQTDDEVVALEQHFLVVLRALADGSFSYCSTRMPSNVPIVSRVWTSAPSAAVQLDPSSQLHRIWPKVSALDRDWGHGFQLAEPPANLASVPEPHFSPLSSSSTTPEPVNRRQPRRAHRRAAPRTCQTGSPPLSFASVAGNFTYFFNIKI